MDKGVSLRILKEANDASLSEMSEDESPTDANMIAEERDNLLSTVQLSLTGAAKRRIHCSQVR